MVTQFKLPVVANKTFTRQIVTLDGTRYERCKFTDCQITFSGGPAEMAECHILGNTSWDLRNAAAITVMVLQQCGWKISYGDGEKPVPIPQSPTGKVQ